MKILIAADMEGVTGVVHWDHVTSTHLEYPRFRRLMTGDVNAAIRGAFEGGATEVVVTDGHANGRNILIEELDGRARLNSGTPAPWSMVQGVEQGVDGVMLVGYHARIGAENAILEHTWSDERVANFLLNDRPTGEIGINAAICGHFGAPVILVTGDQTACAEAEEFLGRVETAIVKRATGRMAAECLTPEASGRLIFEAAQRAVQRLATGDAPQPFRLPSPLTMAIDFVQSEMADRAALLPGFERQGRRISCTAENMLEVSRLFRAALSLARG